MAEDNEEKDLSVEGPDDLKKKVSDAIVVGDPNLWALIGKASSQKQGWMKTTKALKVDDGCIVQTETQQRNQDGSWALSQGLVYVPDISIDDLKGSQ